MEKTKSKAGFVISRRPRRYKTTQPQLDFKDAAKFCGIEKGISRTDLQDRMRNCIPKFFKDLREQREKESGQ